jgi:hypothetical protein
METVYTCSISTLLRMWHEPYRLALITERPNVTLQQSSDLEIARAALALLFDSLAAQLER